MQLYNSKTDVDEQAMINKITSQCPKACLTGMTAANIATEENYRIVVTERFDTFSKEVRKVKLPDETNMDSDTKMIETGLSMGI